VISTWAIATRALWPEDALIWESSDPYLYLRTSGDGRIICGGEDEDFADEDARDAPDPGLPLIGKLPGHPRVHAVRGYGGNGITFSRIAAEIVRADLTGATDADAALFAFEA